MAKKSGTSQRLRRDDVGQECSVCRVYQPYSEYWKDRSRTSGYSYECKACYQKRAPLKKESPQAAIARLERNRERRKRPEIRERYRKTFRTWDLKKRYGLTYEQYNALIESQSGQCAICGGDLLGLDSRKVHVDHCHDSGQVRGVLCHHCNMLVGFARNSPTVLAKAIEYLTKA